MMKRLFILILLIGLTIPMITSAGAPRRIETYSPNIAFNFTIEANSRSEIGIPIGNPGDFIYIEFTVVSGNGIDVIIADQENRDAFSDSQSYEYLARYQNQNSLSISVSVPNADSWYVIFFNPDSSVTTIIQGSISNLISDIPSFVNLSIFFFLFTIVGIFGALYWKGRVTRKTKGYPLKSQVLRVSWNSC